MYGEVDMLAAHIVGFETPKKVALNGIWYGPKKPKRLIIWVHGLSSSAFSGQRVVSQLVDKKTAVMTFNNRGHDTVTRVSRSMSGGRSKSVLAGAAHEKFEECIDDIQGAVNFARRRGVKAIYLAGHSTGCQKVIYWGHKKGNGVKGIMLFAPVSDYAGMLKRHGAKKMARMVGLAKRMVRTGNGSELISRKIWTEEQDDAYRFISLYAPESVEQSIFPYFDSKRPARIFKSVNIPVLTLWADKDEYSDRPSKQIAKWFNGAGVKHQTVAVIPNATHTFKGGEVAVKKTVKKWLTGLEK